MKPAKKSPEIFVFYDGECNFCAECVKWILKRVTATALPFQSTDLSRFSVTYERCSKEVVAIINGKVFGGADAVAKLLRTSGHKIPATLITLSGPLGRKGYSWVATHRDGLTVRALHYFIKLSNH